MALVIISATLYSSIAADGSSMSFALSSSNTLAASDTNSLEIGGATTNAPYLGSSFVTLLTGLTAGSTVFTAKYRAITAGTASFQTRTISVIPF